MVSWGLLARMPMGMSSLALVLLVRSEGGSYATAGIVTRHVRRGVGGRARSSAGAWSTGAGPRPCS